MRTNRIDKTAGEISGPPSTRSKPRTAPSETFEVNDAWVRLHASPAVSWPRDEHRGSVRNRHVQHRETSAAATPGSVADPGKSRELEKPAAARRKPAEGWVISDRLLGFASLGAIIFAIVVGLTVTIAVGEDPLARSPASAASDAGDLDDYFVGLVRLGIARDPHVSRAPAVQPR